MVNQNPGYMDSNCDNGILISVMRGSVLVLQGWPVPSNLPKSSPHVIALSDAKEKRPVLTADEGPKKHFSAQICH